MCCPGTLKHIHSPGLQVGGITQEPRQSTIYIYMYIFDYNIHHYTYKYYVGREHEGKPGRDMKELWNEYRWMPQRNLQDQVHERTGESSSGDFSSQKTTVKIIQSSACFFHPRAWFIICFDRDPRRHPRHQVMCSTLKNVGARRVQSPSQRVCGSGFHKSRPSSLLRGGNGSSEAMPSRPSMISGSSLLRYDGFS